MRKPSSLKRQVKRVDEGSMNRQEQPTSRIDDPTSGKVEQLGRDQVPPQHWLEEIRGIVARDGSDEDA